MKQNGKNNVAHLNGILNKIQNHFSVSDTKFEMDLEYSLLFNELVKIYKDISEQLLERTLFELKIQNLNFNDEEFKNKYAKISDSISQKQNEYYFYLQLNHSIKTDIVFKSFQIAKLEGEEKTEIIRQIKIFSKNNGYNLINVDYVKNHLYVFKTKSHSYDHAREKFYSVFHLYKGILEFSYQKFRWHIGMPRSIKNKKEQSFFKYPQFVYVRNHMYVDFIEHENYPYNYMIDTENSSDIKYFEKTIELINHCLDNGLERILSDCFRLYSRAIDTPYPDQAFLYFWNILECITLSDHGNTELVLKRIQIYFPDVFWNTYTNSIDSLRKIRNNRVHTGKGDIKIRDLNFLKYLCDYAIFFHIGNPPDSHKNIKILKHLDVFYTLKDNPNLNEVKDLIDFVIEVKNRNGNDG